MACGEPGMRRNGLRILVEINNKLYEEVSFGNNAADVLQQCCHQCAAMLSVWQLYAYRPYSYYGQELEN